MEKQQIYALRITHYALLSPIHRQPTLRVQHLNFSLSTSQITPRTLHSAPFMATYPSALFGCVPVTELQGQYLCWSWLNQRRER